MKPLEQNFIDWVYYVFGIGYEDGLEPIIPGLKVFLSMLPDGHEGYYYKELEGQFGSLAAWLFITVLNKANIIDYGSSLKSGWLTSRGIALKNFMASKSTQELVDLVCQISDEFYLKCDPSLCNCDKKCSNPFWEAKDDR